MENEYNTKKAVKLYKMYIILGAMLLLLSILTFLNNDRIFFYDFGKLLMSLFLLIYGLLKVQKIKDSYINFTETGLSFKSNGKEYNFQSLEELSFIEIYDKTAYVYDKHYDKFAIFLNDYYVYRNKSDINSIKTDLNRLNDNINKEKKRAK